MKNSQKALFLREKSGDSLRKFYSPFFSMDSSSEAPLTVSQLTQAIKWNLEGMFPAVFLQGEVSNCKLQTSGHLYFSLKDAGAQIAAVMFRTEVSQLKTLP